MNLSLYKLLQEITARTGPRTGGLEINKDVVWNISKDIADKLQTQQVVKWSYDDGRRPKLEPVEFEILADNPITGTPTRTVVIVKSPLPKSPLAEWDFKQRKIILYILDILHEFMETEKLEKIIYGLLMHELAHRFDPSLKKAFDEPVVLTKATTSKGLRKAKRLARQRAELRRYKAPPKGVADEKYINQPVEIVAFLQQTIEEIEKEIPRLRNRMIQTGESKEAKERLRLNPEFLLKLSPTWEEIKGHLTPENQKRFLMTAARLVRLV